MTPAELEQVRAALEMYADDLFYFPRGIVLECQKKGVRLAPCYSEFGKAANQALAILDAEPAPVTDKDREEKSEPKYIDEDWADAEKVFDRWFTGYECFAAAEIARIRTEAVKAERERCEKAMCDNCVARGLRHCKMLGCAMRHAILSDEKEDNDE
jgi:hypothetical protein